MCRLVVLLLLWVLPLPACVPQPRELPGRLEGVARRGEVPGTAQGVTLLASAERWTAAAHAPADVVPLMITVINDGSRALRLEHGQFTLTPRSDLAAEDGAASRGPVLLALTPHGRAQALPEGPLAPGETARGFVYFPATPGGAAQVQVRLVDGASGEVIDVVTAAVAARKTN